MIDYNNIKNIVLHYDPIIGELTLDNFLEIINIFLEDNIEFENTVLSIYQKHNCDKEIVKQIMLLSSTNIIRFYVDLIQDKL